MNQPEPSEDCGYCNGTGIVVDYVPYGYGNTRMESTCDCVLEQMEEEELSNEYNAI